MAPQPQAGNADADIDVVNSQLRAVVAHLYNVMVQVMGHQGSRTDTAMHEEITRLIQDLLALSQTTRTLNVKLPPELIQYVQSGRNPDVFTREFVESTMKMNQNLKGKTEAFGQFRDVLAKTMIERMDDVADDVHRVVKNTGGSVR